MEEEEEQYRLKIRQMMMRKAEIKQRMRLVDNAEEIEVVKRQIEEEVPNIKEPSRKSAPKSIHTQK